MDAIMLGLLSLAVILQVSLLASVIELVRLCNRVVEVVERHREEVKKFREDFEVDAEAEKARDADEGAGGSGGLLEEALAGLDGSPDEEARRWVA